MTDSPNRYVICIVGPTGVGKSSIGLRVAEKLNGEIISADSRQFYKFMAIGTDKPTEEYLSRVKHHFIDCLDPSEKYNAGKFGKQARKVIDEILKKSVIPVIIGGSGLYVKGILEGFFDETAKDDKIKAQLQEKILSEGNEALYNELQLADPDFAAQVSVNDAQRIVRGLEVFTVTGKPLTEHWKEFRLKSNFKTVLIGLNRDRKHLYDKINERVDNMINSGLIDEVRALKKMGYRKELNSLQTYGYQEVFDYLENRCTLEEMIEEIKKRSRNFAKRQITWFKKMQGIEWMFIDDKKTDDVADEIIELYKRITK